eukprot:12670984-Alexandrium_andersonii.AAC.1
MSPFDLMIGLTGRVVTTSSCFSGIGADCTAATIVQNTAAQMVDESKDRCGSTVRSQVAASQHHTHQALQAAYNESIGSIEPSQNQVRAP